MAKDLHWAAAQYAGAPLDPASVADDPLVQFRRWFAEATTAGVPQPNTMCLATVGADGRPSARMVLLKEVDDAGFVFYGNYESRKGKELAAQPVAALTFYWHDVHRQVRIEGRVERLTAAESDAYFASRPRGSQLGAIASPQSQVIPDRAVLDRRVAELVAEHGEGPLPRPDGWGGYRVIPDVVELWQGQANRLHDRVRYRRELATWIKERLAP
jgi:pyridoxamine 5'-phosphate oxidase